MSGCSNFSSGIEDNVRYLMDLLPTESKKLVLSEVDRYTSTGTKGETVIDHEQMYYVIMEAVEHTGIVVGDKT